MNFLQGRRLANTTSPQIRIPWGEGGKDDLFPSPLYGPLSGFRNPETALKVLKSDKANRDYESFPPLSLFLFLSLSCSLSLSSFFCLARRCTVYDSTGFKIKSITDFVWLSFLFFFLFLLRTSCN